MRSTLVLAGMLYVSSRPCSPLKSSKKGCLQLCCGVCAGFAGISATAAAKALSHTLSFGLILACLTNLAQYTAWKTADRRCGTLSSPSSGLNVKMLQACGSHGQLQIVLVVSMRQMIACFMCPDCQRNRVPESYCLHANRSSTLIIGLLVT